MHSGRRGQTHTQLAGCSVMPKEALGADGIVFACDAQINKKVPDYEVIALHVERSRQSEINGPSPRAHASPPRYFAE